MKKYLTILFFLCASFGIGIAVVHAQATCPSGYTMDALGGCDPTSSVVTTGGPGQAAVPLSQTPTAQTSGPVAPTTSAAPTQPAAGAGGTSGNFVPLTQIPAISAIASNQNQGLANFLQTLYQYCIGIAAALAVIMITWAGLTWMSAGDNTEQISQAKKRIQDAIFGLVLVLSPTIVFGIINPGVLNVNIGPDIQNLQPSTNGSSFTLDPSVGDNTCSFSCSAGYICQQGQCVANTSAIPANAAPIPNGGAAVTPAQQAQCAQQPGCAVGVSSTINPNTGLPSDICSCTTSTIQSTGQINPGCSPIANGAVLTDDGSGQQSSCCMHQPGYQVTSQTNPQTLTMTYYCTQGS